MYGDDWPAYGDEIIKVHVSKLRRQLRRINAAALIEVRWGFGYRLAKQPESVTRTFTVAQWAALTAAHPELAASP